MKHITYFNSLNKIFRLKVLSRINSHLFNSLLTWGGFLLFLVFLCLVPSKPKGDEAFFARLPILHGGRIKPLDTFSREHLLVFSGRTKITATAWLKEVLFDPFSANTKKIFKLPNPEIIDVLNIPESKKRLYSFKEISKALDKNLPLLNKIKNKSEKEQSLLEKQLLNLYVQANVYGQLSRSLSLILPLFSYNISPSPIEGLVPNQQYHYLDMLKFRQKIKQKIKTIKKEKFDDLSLEEKTLAVLSFRIDMVSQDENNNLFKIIPPQWRDNKDIWHSPWGLIKAGRGSPATSRYLKSWESLLKHYHTKPLNVKATQNASEQEAKQKPKTINLGEQVYQEAIALSKGWAKPHLLYMETFFNHFAFFLKSLLCYILSFLLCVGRAKAWAGLSNVLYKWSFRILLVGGVFHFTGLVFRVVIMGRPPVATLYESILFVSFIVVLVTLLMEKRKPDRHLLMTGSLVGAVLCFIAFKYKGLESMELLVPVLNTNFWLSTHVICITLGYGFAILSSMMAHVYLFIKCFRGKASRLLSIYKNMSFFVFMALFFCLFGTILGGIWADQSWGRFWGWDPKENGALLIVMGLLVLLHGRQGGLFKETGMALGLILINITVALSWFGVNLLGVGLHSYGFVNGALYGLIAFCLGELTLFFGLFWVFNQQRKK